MNDTLKKHIISILITFVSTFLTVVGYELVSTETLEFTKATISALILSGARSALKVVIETYSKPVVK